MVSVKRLSLIILPAVLMLVVAACGDDDPTATSAPPPPPPADEATATPVPDDTPPPADEPPPPPPEEEEEPVIPCPGPCIVANNFTVEDGKFEFRIGEDINPDGLFGYPNGAAFPPSSPAASSSAPCWSGQPSSSK